MYLPTEPLREVTRVKTEARRESRTVRFELVLRPSERDALEALAERNDRSLAAELRAALAAWIAFRGREA